MRGKAEHKAQKAESVSGRRCMLKSSGCRMYRTNVDACKPENYPGPNKGTNKPAESSILLFAAASQGGFAASK